MGINLIYARAANGVIGKDGAMPWHLPEDLAHFKRLTQGCPVIMGRKTWDSLPPKFRPLPGRTNIVITRQSDWQAEGAQRAASLKEALQLAGAAPEVWIIGGAQIYAQAEPLASRAEVTEIAQDFDGDAYAPVLGPQWTEAAREEHTTSAGLKFSFVTYNKRREN
ncbi:MAG: dihydrofolate reductase [Polaromonas sp.]|uniref:dihydrofolate reductase n=1 Tax=Polaromonas sp. TaxID=1869339 RepID=UPI00248A053E|nr:dihydrofolate reductase [Polaromonas sp.]MDI1238627.1 dihydrofolate reductase [Polaromonas sp.]